MTGVQTCALPISILDGGHIIMACVERIRRRPLSGRLIEYVNGAFAILLISFMLYVTVFDIKRFSIIRSLFKREPQVQQVEKPAVTETNTAR